MSASLPNKDVDYFDFSFRFGFFQSLGLATGAFRLSACASEIAARLRQKSMCSFSPPLSVSHTLEQIGHSCRLTPAAVSDFAVDGPTALLGFVLNGSDTTSTDPCDRAGAETGGRGRPLPDTGLTI